MRRLLPLLFPLIAGCSSSSMPAPPAPGPDPIPEKTTFDVTWAPQTHVIDNAKDLLLKAEPEANGVTNYHFKSDPRLMALQPGDVAVLAGIAYRKIESVMDTGSELVVAASHTKLTDAITKGKMAWDTPIDFTNPQTINTMSVSVGDGISIKDTSPGSLSYMGMLGGYDINVTFTPNGGRLSLSLRASKTIENQERVALTADGFIDRFRGQGDWSWDGVDLQYHQGTNQFHGELHVRLAAFNAGVSQDLLSIPLGIRFPVQVGPVPMIITLKANINVTAILTAGESSSQAEVRLAFDTTQGIAVAASPNPVGMLASPILDVVDGGSASGVAAGFAGCIEFPRVEAGFLGELVSVGLTQNNCAATDFTFQPACQEVRASIVGKALYRLGFMGFSVADGEVELYNQVRRRGTQDRACM